MAVSSPVYAHQDKNEQYNQLEPLAGIRTGHLEQICCPKPLKHMTLELDKLR